MAKQVMAFGSFDILHSGHASYLASAKALGDYLIVVVARDESIRKFKKRDPVFGEKDRVTMVSSLKSVDKAVLGNKIKTKADQYKVVKKFKPDLLVFGYDQNVDLAKLKLWLKENGLQTRIKRLNVPYKPGSCKSSVIRESLGL